MSLLDELQSQAEEKRRQLDQQERQATLIRTAYEKHVNPRLKRVYAYLNEVVGHLNFLEQHTECSYRIPGAGEINGFYQTDYRLAADNSIEMRDIQLRFDCQRDRPVHCDVETDSEAEKLRDELARHKLKFDYRGRFDGHNRKLGVRFSIEPPIPVLIRLRVSMDNLNIALDINNMPDLGLYRRDFRAHEINRDFMESLGRFILRQENHLLNLGLPEQTRQQLNEKLKQEQAERQLETTLARQYAPTQENKTTRPGLINKLLKRT